MRMLAMPVRVCCVIAMYMMPRTHAQAPAPAPSHHTELDVMLKLSRTSISSSSPSSSSHDHSHDYHDHHDHCHTYKPSALSLHSQFHTLYLILLFHTPPSPMSRASCYLDTRHPPLPYFTTAHPTQAHQQLQLQLQHHDHPLQLR